VAGPLLAAVLLQGNLFGLDWRPIFLINLPLGIATFLGVLALVRESRAPRALRLDPLGMGLVSAGLLQATSLSFFVVVSQLGQSLGLITAANGAALIAAGLLSVLVFPISALTILRRMERRKTNATAEPSPA